MKSLKLLTLSAIVGLASLSGGPVIRGSDNISESNNLKQSYEKTIEEAYQKREDLLTIYRENMQYDKFLGNPKIIRDKVWEYCKEIKDAQKELNNLNK